MLKKGIKNWLKANKKKKKFTAFYKQFIQPGDLCFDIGANFGNRTETFLGLGANVICVEPIEESLLRLKKKFNKNKNVRILPIAISNKVEEKEIHVSNFLEVCTMSNRFMEEYKGQKHNIHWHDTRIINTSTLDALIEEYGTPTFCKIDVEGFEKEVLEGLSQIIPFMSFEYNEKLKDLALECLQILSKFNSLTYRFSPDESMEFTSKEWMEVKEFYTYIQLLPSEILTGDIYVKSGF